MFKKVFQILINDDRFIKLVICYMRLKSIIMMIEEENPNFLKDFINAYEKRKNLLSKTVNPLLKEKFNDEHIKKITDIINDLGTHSSTLFESVKLNVQLLIIHIVNYVTKYEKFPPWLDADPIINNFSNLIIKYIDVYQTLDVPMPTGRMDAVPFLINFGDSLLIFKEILPINTKILDSGPILKLEH